MKNIILEKALENERLLGRGIWRYIEDIYGIQLELGDKFLIYNQLEDYNDSDWKSLWEGVNQILQRFQYHSFSLDKMNKCKKEFEKIRAQRALNGELYLTG